MSDIIVKYLTDVEGLNLAYDEDCFAAFKQEKDHLLVSALWTKEQTKFPEMVTRLLDYAKTKELKKLLVFVVNSATNKEFLSKNLLDNDFLLSGWDTQKLVFSKDVV